MRVPVKIWEKMIRDRLMNFGPSLSPRTTLRHFKRATLHEYFMVIGLSVIGEGGNKKKLRHRCVAVTSRIKIPHKEALMQGLFRSSQRTYNNNVAGANLTLN